MAKQNILFLTQWYPHRYDAMAGLFVRKHAEAVARQGRRVCVLYLHHDKTVRETEVVEQQFSEVSEVYVYYSCSFWRAMCCGYQAVEARWGRPDVCQVNVLTKNAVLAYYLKLMQHVPYVVLEHWTGYLPVNNIFQHVYSAPQRLVLRFLAKQASCIMPVSRMLQGAMQDCGVRNKRWQVMNNVVDDFFYTAGINSGKHTPFHWLHVSCFDEQHKNVTGILRTMYALKEKGRDVRLTIIGVGTDFEEVKEKADSWGLTDKVVFFVGEQTPEEVWRIMQEVDAFVLFSRYENAPVVLSECLAVGLPIVSTNVGGIAEMVRSEAGVLIDNEDETALFNAMNHVMEHYADYDTMKIKEYGKLYTYQAVGKALCAVYDMV